MCLAVPMKVAKIEGNFAVVELGRVRQRANIQMLNNLKIGDYILIHAGFGIQKVDKKEAEKTRQLLMKIK